MKLRELSESYRMSADLILERIEQLKSRERRPGLTESDRFALRRRISTLYGMHHEMMELATLAEHYYERGYKRNAKYTV